MTTPFPAARGAALALLSALLFGISTPLIQRLGTDVGGWMTAALLYAGAALAGLALRAKAGQEAPLQTSHLPRLLAMALLGAGLAPAALAWGLQHTNGVGASLMLTLEAVFTVVLARALYHESLGQRIVLAMLLLTSGAGLLVLDTAHGGTASLWGLLAVLSATLCWGVDNCLSRRLADVDISAVVLVKATAGATGSLVLAFTTQQTTVAMDTMLGLIAIGALGYGLSLRCYLLAQRSFGAARTASVFATAPFIGALVAYGLGERAFTLPMAIALCVMAMGVVLHTWEKHEHPHTHASQEHDHAHYHGGTHDDGHHSHPHTVDASPRPGSPHSHPHRHAPMQHAHPHAPDVHHQHSH